MKIKGILYTNEINKTKISANDNSKRDMRPETKEGNNKQDGTESLIILAGLAMSTKLRNLTKTN